MGANKAMFSVYGQRRWLPNAGPPNLAGINCSRSVINPSEPLLPTVGEPRGRPSPYPWPIPILAANVAATPELSGHFDPVFPLFPSFELDYPDQIRADELLNEFSTFVTSRKSGADNMPQFILLRPAELIDAVLPAEGFQKPSLQHPMQVVDGMVQPERLMSVPKRNDFGNDFSATRACRFSRPDTFCPLLVSLAAMTCCANACAIASNTRAFGVGVCFIIMVVASGCGAGSGTSQSAGSSTPPSNPVATPPTPRQRAKFLYTSDTLSINAPSPPANIFAFSVDPSTGALTALPNSPVAFELDPHCITLDVQQTFAFVADPTAGIVRVYRIDQNTAALQEVSGSPYPSGQEPSSIAVHPSNQFIYITGLSNSNVYAFRFDSTAGTLSSVAGSPFPAATNSVGTGTFVAVDPLGKFLFMEDTLGVYAFRIDNQSGALALVNSFPAYLPGSLAIDPNDAYVYVPDTKAMSVIETYAIDPNSGALSLASTSLMVNIFGSYLIQLDSTGHFAYTVEDGQYLQVYTVTNGKFSPVGLNRIGALGSLALAIDPSGQFLYAPQTGSQDNINAWRIDSTTGDVTQLSGAPFATVAAPTSIAIVRQR